MGGEIGVRASDSGSAISVAELGVYLLAGGYVVAGLLLASGTGELRSLETALGVGPWLLVLLGALGLRREAVTPPVWRHVGGWCLGGVGVATTAVAWLVAGEIGLAAVPVAVPTALGVETLVLAGSLGGGVGFAVGAVRIRDVRRRRAPARLLDAAPDAAWLFDAERSTTRYVNAGYERVFGQSVASLAADPTALEEAVHPDDRETLRAELDRLAAGDPAEFELRVDPGSEFGRWAWVSARPVYRDGAPDALGFVARDVTSRRHHRERLVSLHDATRQLFQAESETEAARVATDAAEEVLDLRVNTIWLYDEEREELVSAAASEAATADSRSLPTFKTGDSLAREVFESGEAKVYDDVRTAPGGHQAPSRSEIVLPLGEFGVFMAGSTTTDRFEAWQVSLGRVLAANVEVALARIEQTRALEESRRALEQRNERLDEFTSVVSHDLRNPLAVARGHLEFVREECDSESVETIDDALQRMETLIDDLLTLAREGEAIDDPKAVDLDPHVRRCWESVETGGARLVVDTDATVRADGSRLAQLFENLFRNAVEHGETDEGPVTVTVGRLPDGFYVEDDGPGVPPDQREAVFEAGYSTDSRGSGFGLSIVQTIAEAHGWSVTVTAGSGGGARFEITGVSIVR